MSLNPSRQKSIELPSAPVAAALGCRLVRLRRYARRRRLFVTGYDHHEFVPSISASKRISFLSSPSSAHPSDGPSGFFL